MKKKYYFFVIFFLLVFQGSYSQNVSNEMLSAADTLFFKKKYSEALVIYESLMKNYQSASTSMLLKMAFVAEHNQDISKALYYLQLYYNRKPNKATLEHISDLADKYSLSGYKVSDISYFQMIYHRYYKFIVIIAIIVCSVIFYTLIVKNFGEVIPTRYGIVMVLMLAGTYGLLNLIPKSTKAILAEDSTFLMSDASSGAQVLTVLSKGHCFEVLNQKDIWLEVNWDAQKAYIKRTQSYVIQGE